jgi:hypothetical protein
MENRAVISFLGDSPAPGADSDAFERYRQWGTEARTPLIMTIPEVIGLDLYQIVSENMEYPQSISISHYKSLSEWKNSAASSQRAALGDDFKLWIDRGVIDYVWSATYVLIKGYRNKSWFSSNNQDTRIENAPIVYLQAYRMTVDEQEKYFKWFTEYGCTIFMPLFIKMPGLVGYDCYEYSGLRLRDYIVETEYPRYLSIIYFENMNAYDNFVGSPEFTGFRKSMRTIFPRGLNIKWHVQYHLVKSLRK